MKTLWMKTIVLLFLGVGTLHAQDREEVPGDNFSLEGALELFKKSASPEEFERLLNLPESEVNNLDLNGDGYTDYIRVIDRNKGNIHTFTLQAVISAREFQDIAVISLEKLADGKAVLQITGDPDVYGIETIIEPTSEVRVNAGTTTTRTVVNVWTWPSVQYIYSPFYSPWVSPWYWDYRPFWWRPWRPVAYIVYYPRWTVYQPYYRYCDAPRIRYAHQVYYPHRSASVIVYNRHREQITTYRSTRTVYGETRGRDNNTSRDNRTTRYDYTRDRNTTNRTGTSSREWNSRDNNRERPGMNQGHREENNSRNTGATGWRNESNTNANERPRTTEQSNSAATNRSPNERSTNQNNRVFEQPRENRSNNSGSGGNNRPEVRQESRQSRPTVAPPSQSRQSNSGGQQQKSSPGSSGKRGRD
ncbi:MAG: hypothetical protein KIT62_10675 [Cyclobacteriaceae bacterium]|nr:hypothetical protein [Cyclobacteriaceae bacterium]